MKSIVLLIIFLNSLACKTQIDKRQTVSAVKNTARANQTTEEELSSFLDSIGQLNPNNYTAALQYQVDSTLNGQTNLNIKLSVSDFEKFKTTAENGEIDFDLAKRIFPQIELDSSIADILENNKLPIGFYSFDKKEKDFNEFAIAIGHEDDLSWSNDVYFFKYDKVIAKHKIVHRDGLDLKHFKNEFNETVVYYKVNYESGSGIWWYQFNFHSYDKDKLLPTLTEIENINLQYPWSIRAYSITSTVLSTKPLKFKFVFKNQFTDTLGNQINFINDSTEIAYNFDRQKKVYEPIFTDTKLNRLKLLTYFHANNEVLFVNSNYELFKKDINGQDKVKRQAILNYLSELRLQLDTKSIIIPK